VRCGSRISEGRVGHAHSRRFRNPPEEPYDVSTQAKAATSERVRAIVASLLEVDDADVTDDGDFYDDLGADSLEKVELVMRLEAEFGVSIDADTAAGLRNVDDVVEVLTQRRAA
jgi:acyl carrier protein